MYLATKTTDIILYYKKEHVMQERGHVGLHMELLLFDDRVTENYRSYYYRHRASGKMLNLTARATL